MANIKSQKKRILTNEKARMRNRAVRSELKTATRVVEDAVEAKNAADAYAAAHAACRLMDKAASKGIIHKRQASNRKSGIMLLANTIVTDEVREAYKPTEKKKVEPKGGTKKAAAKAERIAQMEEASKEKATRRATTEKDQQSAAKKKAKEAEAAAKAEAAAEAEAAASEEAAPEE